MFLFFTTNVRERNRHLRFLLRNYISASQSFQGALTEKMVAEDLSTAATAEVNTIAPSINVAEDVSVTIIKCFNIEIII